MGYSMCTAWRPRGHASTRTEGHGLILPEVDPVILVWTEAVLSPPDDSRPHPRRVVPLSAGAASLAGKAVGVAWVSPFKMIKDQGVWVNR